MYQFYSRINREQVSRSLYRGCRLFGGSVIGGFTVAMCLRKVCPQCNTAVHVKRSVFDCCCQGALHCMHYGIALWAQLSEPLVKDKVRLKNHNTACSKLRDHNYRYVRVTERYTETSHVKKKKWLNYRSCGKFITLLTFELSGFREPGFLFFAAFSALQPLISLVRRLNTREGRMQKTDTQTHRTTTVTLVAHARQRLTESCYVQTCP